MVGSFFINLCYSTLIEFIAPAKEDAFLFLTAIGKDFLLQTELAMTAFEKNFKHSLLNTEMRHTQF